MCERCRGNPLQRGPQPRSTAAPPAREGPRGDAHKILARIVDAETQKPLSNIHYEVVDEHGTAVAQGQTDWQGMVDHDVPQAGSYTVRVTDDGDGIDEGEHEGDGAEIQVATDGSGGEGEAAPAPQPGEPGFQPVEGQEVGADAPDQIVQIEVLGPAE